MSAGFEPETVEDTAALTEGDYDSDPQADDGEDAGDTTEEDPR